MNARPRLGVPVPMIAALAALMFARSLVAALAPPAAFERWYALTLDGRPIGVIHDVRELRAASGGADEPDLVVSRRTTQMRLRRGSTEVEMTTIESFTETVRGVPVSASLVSRGGGSSAEVAWTFGDDVIQERATAGGRVLAREHPMPTAEWLTPIGVSRRVASVLAARGSQIEFRTLGPVGGTEPVVVRAMRAEGADGAETLEIRGRSVAVMRWAARSSASPGIVSEQWWSDRGVLVRESTALAIGTLESTLSTEAEAKAAAAAAAAPEIMVATFATPDRRIDEPQQVRRLELRLRLPVEAGAIPQRRHQSVTDDPRGPRWRRVVVDLDRPGAARDARGPDARDRAASPMIDHLDPAVRALHADAARSIDASAGPGVRAEAFRRTVRRHIRGVGLGRLLATAGETARDASGDCTEHAVLLAALLRADGIPARVATGLVYAESFAGSRDVLAWHMWTRAWIDGAWVDLDATLDVPFDATHLLVDDGPLDGAAASAELGSLLGLVGGLEIEIVEARDAAGRSRARARR